MGVLKRWLRDPVAFVREGFNVEPDKWQLRALKSYAVNRRIALQACKGPGKTTVLAWCIWHFMLHEHANIVALAQSGAQLKTNLWKELAKWRDRCELLKSEFEMGEKKIFKPASPDHPNYPETWFCHARTWSKTEDEKVAAQTLQGLHQAFSMIVMDESGGMPDAIAVAADGILAELKSEGGRSVILQAGNPTMLAGPLYRAATRERSMWDVIVITGDPDDPERSPRIDPKWAKEQIAKYGRDDPWVLVNVFGRFPPASFNALIGPDEVRAACGRHLRESQYNFAAKIIPVDVARYGDDASVIWPRQGLAAFHPTVRRHVDSYEGAGIVAKMANEWEPDSIMIDGTGGFGSGWIDALRMMGHEVIEVLFSAKATDPKYFNKRSEMYFLLVEWIRAGGALPPVEDEAGGPVALLIEDLTETRYTFKGDKLILEEKDQVKERLGRSPDYGDALAISFAYPVAVKERDPLAGIDARGDFNHAKTEYDPLARFSREPHWHRSSSPRTSGCCTRKWDCVPVRTSRCSAWRLPKRPRILLSEKRPHSRSTCAGRPPKVARLAITPPTCTEPRNEQALCQRRRRCRRRRPHSRAQLARGQLRRLRQPCVRGRHLARPRTRRPAQAGESDGRSRGELRSRHAKPLQPARSERSGRARPLAIQARAGNGFPGARGPSDRAWWRHGQSLRSRARDRIDRQHISQ